MWYTIENFSISSGRVITAKVRVPTDCVWFDGHFPSKPILPGVAQLMLVMDILKQALDPAITVDGVSRVRFKQMILPEDVIDVNISPTVKKDSTYGFRLSTGTDLACSGSIKIAQP
jgi:3-hydroxymyristoyl/3-hydroxydecanoyl-(acyl carrier protein) dehydratase